MTDKQFNGFLRLLIRNLKTVQKNIDNKELAEKELLSIINDLQATIES